MLDKIINKLRYMRMQYQQRKQIRRLLIAVGKKNIFLVQTPTHSNIGDHAIAAAQIDFLKRNAPEWNIVEINQTLLDTFVRYYRRRVGKNDIIILVGGGNFGNEYMREENLRRNVIANFRDNKVISFPQTIYYTDDSKGKRELAITQDLIAQHKNFTIVAREQVSLKLAKQYFPSTNVLLTPDIVLSMDKSQQPLERDGALLVLRGDAERILTDENRSELEAIVTRHFDKVVSSDMHHTSWIMTEELRGQVLKAKFEQFRSAKLVITDRLHGMVFAAITGTPCIAFSNYNQKVSGTYSWINSLDYIRFVKVEDDIEQHVNELLSISGDRRYDLEKLSKHFEPLSNIVNG